jgi:hypothetical protein
MRGHSFLLYLERRRHEAEVAAKADTAGPATGSDAAGDWYESLARKWSFWL